MNGIGIANGDNATNFRCIQATASDNNQHMASTQPRHSRALVSVRRDKNTLPSQRWTPVNRKLISLALISHLISSQFLMPALISSMSLLSAAPGGITSMGGLEMLSADKSFITHMAEASPAPTPLRAASARSATSQRVPPINGSMFGKRDLAARVESTSEATHYNDIITEAIENFMAGNREGDPDDTTAAFCRMIIYECNKLSSNRKMTKKPNSRSNTGK